MILVRWRVTAGITSRRRSGETDAYAIDGGELRMVFGRTVPAFFGHADRPLYRAAQVEALAGLVEQVAERYYVRA